MPRWTVSRPARSRPFMPSARDAAPLEPLDGTLRLDRLVQIATLAQQLRFVLELPVLGADLQDVPADPGDEQDQDQETLPPDERVEGADIEQVALPIGEVAGRHGMSSNAETHSAGAGRRPASTVTAMISWSSCRTMAWLW